MKKLLLFISISFYLMATSHVQVVHNSASPTVDVYVDGALAVEDFTYRSATPVLELGTSFTVGIAPADGEVIAEFPFDLMDGGEYVVMATGLLGDETTPFDLAATATTFGADAGNVGLEVYHGSTDAPAVDVLADGAVLLSNLAYGSFSGYTQVPAADYVIGVAPTGGESIADFSASLSGLGGGSAVVFASGFLAGGADDPAFGLFAALNDGTVLALPAYSMGNNNTVMVHNFTLDNLYPNPFNPVGTINFTVNERSAISVDLYNILGNKITGISDKVFDIGSHQLDLNLDSYSSGYYMIVLRSGDEIKMKNFTLLK